MASNYQTWLANELHQGITNLWQEDFCTDFEIVAGEKSFHCHKLVLAAVSDYFKAMFSSGMKETEQDKVVFEDISPAMFETIFKILYPPGKMKGHPLAKHSQDDVLELLKLAQRFQMKFLRRLCLDHIQRTLSSDNCIRLWKFGEEIQCEELSEMGRNFVRENIEEMVQSRNLDSLEYDAFVDIITDRNMHVKNEEIIWNAIQNWIIFDEDQRARYIAELLDECCLTEINLDFLIDKISFDPIVRNSNEASKLVKQVWRYSRQPSSHGNLELKFRQCHEKQQVSVLLYYDNKSPKVLGSSKLQGLKIGDDGISSLTPSKLLTAPSSGAWYVSSCVYGQSIYVLNGSKQTESGLLQFDGETAKWISKRSMDVPLVGHTICAVDACLYVCGGLQGRHPNSRVWKYFVDSDSWSEDGEIIAAVMFASSVAYEKKIYIFGGTIERHEPVNCIQVYDTETETGTIFGNLPNPCSFSRALLRGPVAYIVTSDGDIVKICLDNADIDIITSIPLVQRQRFAVDMHADEIHIYVSGRSSTEVPVLQSVQDEDVVPQAATNHDNKSEDSDTEEDFIVNVSTGEILRRKPLLQDSEILGCVSVVINVLNNKM